ncbi:aminoacyl-tRNA hydrolase [Aestuariirhabdus litorea]|uniref:Peptidyl-tRNA hydrolase n=1 Tax=Aestuariirhabdus litorea TaxID=2528527 RepID=A0A3P3VMN5_9GAMM|nr:aminoacyl-tRNA hydrolase [Aestuariirhabdus litorea]RRJ83684.1 aminoacyl-tRNA hydrolase [Aestuariirhabdus litorea]RWW96906.1 aminoacyl-tRNA hydrolase [Endozoicomonadaceae bacterium GTF-13]
MAANAPDSIQLIVGLGNPGPEYERTRHNAGALFVEQLARACGASLQPERKFFGDCARIQLQGHELRLINPTTFMNRSGQAVVAIANFYKIPLEAILVAHDELDIEAGLARLKVGGGHGGHNGLRDIISRMGGNQFMRLRLGIGHPGHSSLVTGHVLSKASQSEQQKLDNAIDEAIRVLPDLLNGAWNKGVQTLHSYQG